MRNGAMTFVTPRSVADIWNRSLLDREPGYELIEASIFDGEAARTDLAGGRKVLGAVAVAIGIGRDRETSVDVSAGITVERPEEDLVWSTGGCTAKIHDKLSR